MTLLIKNIVFTFIVPGSVAIYLPLWLAGSGSLGAPALRILSLPCFAIGGAIYGWCVWDFASFGRGTPAPIDAPRRLVISGLYRLLRNPMYTGVLTVIAGWALWYGSLVIALYLGAVAGLFHLFVTLYEEPHLRQTFGVEYEAYCRRVGRWLPRLRARDEHG